MVWRHKPRCKLSTPNNNSGSFRGGPAGKAGKNLDGRTEDALQAEIQEGLDDLAHGQYTDYDDASLPQWFENIKKRGRKRLKALKNREH